MGMDVFGKQPRSEAGAHFRRNNSGWRGLAEYCCDIAPEITRACKHWLSNDGDGLDDAGATALAKILKARIADGTVAKHALIRSSTIEMLGNVPCPSCNGGKELVCLGEEDLPRLRA
jgi:hypothetical protein